MLECAVANFVGGVQQCPAVKVPTCDHHITSHFMLIERIDYHVRFTIAKTKELALFVMVTIAPHVGVLIPAQLPNVYKYSTFRLRVLFIRWFCWLRKATVTRRNVLFIFIGHSAPTHQISMANFGKHAL